MNNLIDRQDVYEILTKYYHHHTDIQHDALREALSRVPPAKPERIAKVKVRYCVGYCECGQAVNTYSTYCHKCGAKLDWSENE